jgi:spoIIIJ-associated protein
MSGMRSVEVSGADIESAIAKGLKQLDVSRENVIVDVLDEPSRGLLGIGARMARVRLTTAVAPRSEREEFVPSAEKPQTASSSVDNTSVETAASESESSVVAEAFETPYEPYADHDAYNADDEDDEGDLGSGAREIVTDEEQLDDDVQIGKAKLEEILRLMNIDAEVDIERAKRDVVTNRAPWVLHIHGDDLGVLIGHRGKTLSALQYITRLVSSRDTQQRPDFIIDIEDYKTRRQESLERMAYRLAADAIRRHRTVKMEPMPPHERRIIHMALRDNPEIETVSEGEGSHRRVMIIPRD